MGEGQGFGSDWPGPRPFPARLMLDNFPPISDAESLPFYHSVLKLVLCAGRGGRWENGHTKRPSQDGARNPKPELEKRLESHTDAHSAQSPWQQLKPIKPG